MARPQRKVEAAPQPAARPMGLSIFDLDRTLTIQPTYSRFLLFAARHRAPWRLLLVPLLVPVALLYAVKLISRRTMKEAMHGVALGRRLPQRDAVRLADRFARDLIARGLYPEGIARIERERASGRRIVIASAAPHLYVAALARRLGVADVIATASTWRGGCLTPAIDGTNCYGADKKGRIEAFLAAAGIAREMAHIRFFSDHISDLPVFELADEAIAVNPSRALRATATERRWSILDWRGAAR
ncbi:HAD family hydrolase [Sphingopyxis flava]|uniref:HAD-superfamily subfamily IB hydrolase, TIGR01490 n=1 Tax=Sphingopyxis flava TaxID=1507287 RepID=A0A1T5DWY5_9SPHN|nr:HAD-IB family hydrolase [Sphingopyxis flava]SKB76328.1 HAD-superfamily subfamily IB hydrolase, TIGR01490 [Sphingopyxis flava]